MSSFDQAHQVVCKFILYLINEKNSSIWKHIDELSKMNYEKAVSTLVGAAEDVGFSFFKEDWEWVVKKIVETYLCQQERKNCSVIELLKRPIKKHSDNLREYVYEICDYEGDPSWNKEEDYQFRVEYVIEALGDQMEDASVPMLCSCSQEQIEGKGWLPNRFGISCCTGHFQTTISWSDIKDSLSFC